MTEFRIELSPAAIEQAASIESWWQENRLAAPDLFMDELTASLTLLGNVPRIGHAYASADIEGMRRLLLPRTRYHVYYVVHDADRLVRVHAVWHVARGTVPFLI